MPSDDELLADLKREIEGAEPSDARQEAATRLIEKIRHGDYDHERPIGPAFGLTVKRLRCDEHRRTGKHRNNALRLREELIQAPVEHDAERLAAEILYDCVRAEDPESILLLKLRMTLEQLAALEVRRGERDAASGPVDSRDYGDTVAKARGKLEKAAEKWRTQRNETLDAAALQRLNELGISDVQQIHESIRAYYKPKHSDD